jgi:thiamine-phosphate pyrophosphorylase
LDQLSLTLVTDRSQTNGRDLVTVISECLAVGLPAVQVREKDLSGKDLAILCRQLRNLTRDTGAMLIVNDRVDVALAVNADAVQRTGTSLDVKDMRDIAGRNLRIGASVHSLEDARKLKIPVLAIGGITPDRVSEVIAVGARGVGVISGIMSAEWPSEATQLYLKALGGRGRRTPRRLRKKSSTS